MKIVLAVGNGFSALVKYVGTPYMSYYPGLKVCEAVEMLYRSIMFLKHVFIKDKINLALTCSNS